MPVEAESVETKAAAPPKSKKKLFIILGIVAVLVIGGGAGAFLLLAKPAQSKAQQEAEKELAGETEGAEGEKEEKAEGGGHGAPAAEGEKTAASGKKLPADTYAFEFPFSVTLADADKQRHLQFEMTVELSDPELKKTIEERLHKFRDAVITEVSNRVEADVISREGIDRLKRDVAARFDGMLRPGAVRGVYFSQFLTL